MSVLSPFGLASFPSLALLGEYQITESFHTREASLKSVGDLDSSASLVPSRLPSASASQPRPGPTLRGRWPSTLPKAAAAIASRVFRAVTSSSDSRKPRPNLNADYAHHPSAREPSPTIKLSIGLSGISAKLNQLRRDWNKLTNRVFGHILCSPVSLNVSQRTGELVSR